MKNLLLIFCLLLGVTFAKGQNLVPNPSFEDTTHCPLGGDTSLAVGWNDCGDSPDYYNACANLISPLGVPNAYYTGYQNAYDGNAFIGFASTGGVGVTLREFFGAQLNQTLTIGTKYYASFYASSADSGGYHTCHIDKIGLRFSTIPYSHYRPTRVTNFSQIHATTIIIDSTGWTKISGSFIADSAYQYIVVGNSYDNAHTNSLGCNGGNLAYYYIDMICVSTDSLFCNIPEGINEYNQNDISVYPNPANNFIMVENVTNSTDYLIVDILGRTIKLDNINKNNTQIDVSSITDGIYFLVLNKKQYFKILINH